MLRRAALIVLLIAGGAVLFLLQRHKVTTEISPSPALYLVADAEREAERLPLDATQVSDQQEMRVGASMSENVCTRVGTPDDPEVVKMRNYVSAVGTRLTPNVLRTGITYQFCLDENPYFVNAYALPGGYVVVGRGLLSILESEDELAFILGHEISHVDERHAIQRVQYKLASRKLGLESIYQLGQPLQFLYEAGYTKEQEAEADRDSLGLVHDAGYSVKGALDVMQRFEKMEHDLRTAGGSPIEEFASIPFQSLEEYFRSHPPATERRQAIEQIISSRHWDANATVRPYILRHIFLSEKAAAIDTQGKFAKSIATYKEALQQDATYQGALDGLTEVEWRSGDAAAAESAAIAAAAQFPGEESVRILARSGLASNRQQAIDALTSLTTREFPEKPIPQLARVELAGLALSQRANNSEEYRNLLTELGTQPQIQSLIRTEMAWWMYRAGNLKGASTELETAHQVFPASSATAFLRAWIDSEQNHQADAENDGRIYPRDIVAGNHFFASSRAALRAVIAWRTENREQAKNQFQQAASEDPVWLVHNWVNNTYNPATANILYQLQASEQLRRAEIAKKQHQPTN